MTAFAAIEATIRASAPSICESAEADALSESSRSVMSASGLFVPALAPSLAKRETALATSSRRMISSIAERLIPRISVAVMVRCLIIW